jgi:GDP-D-mannose 3', 5'-epimerase
VSVARGRHALVLGAGGFIGSHMARRLRDEGYHVRGVDLKTPQFGPTAAQEFIIADLRDPVAMARVMDRPFDEVYQFAADMGGAGYVFTGENDAAVMHNSALINLHVAEQAVRAGAGRVFYSSSACIYPAHNQTDPANPRCAEDTAYPAAPDSEYGWEKLFSERLFGTYARTRGLAVTVARLHNVYGPEGTWEGGREKAPAALCRKVLAAHDGGALEIWGDGLQTRSFLFIEDCVEAIRRMMARRHPGPLNIGSEEMVSIDDLARMIISISGKRLELRHIAGPVGVRGRTSDNRLVRAALAWTPATLLEQGIALTYRWIEQQMALSRNPRA